MYKDLQLNRDFIESCIELYLCENYKNYDIKIQKHSAFTRFYIVFDEKSLFLDFNFNNKGGTTIQVETGEEQEEKIKIAEYIINHKLSKINIEDKNNQSVLFKNLTEKQFDIILKYIESDKNICNKIIEQLDIEDKKIARLEGRWADKITLTYSKSSNNVRLQGRPLILFTFTKLYFNNIVGENDIEIEKLINLNDEECVKSDLDKKIVKPASIEIIEVANIDSTEQKEVVLNENIALNKEKEEVVNKKSYIFELSDDDINEAIMLSEDLTNVKKIINTKYKVSTNIGNSFKEYSSVKIATPYSAILEANKNNIDYNFENAKNFYKSCMELKMLSIEVEIPEISNEENSIVSVDLYQNNKKVNANYIRKKGFKGTFPKRSSRFPNNPAYIRTVILRLPIELEDGSKIIDTDIPLEVVIDYHVGNEIIYNIDLNNYR